MMNFPKLTTLALLAALCCVSADSFAATYAYRVLNKGVKALPGGGGTSQPAPTYATTGARYWMGGQAITEFVLEPGQRYQLTLVNSAAVEMRGWLADSEGGLARLDLGGSTCGQTASIPTILAPGASCVFALTGIVGMGTDHPEDTFSLKSLNNVAIPTTLILRDVPGNPVPAPDF